MALNQHTLPLLMKTSPKTALSLGFPDIVISTKELFDITGVLVEKSSPEHQYWHGAKEPLPDTKEFFRKIQCELTTSDFKKIRGDEIIADLNHPCELGQYDLVIDPGTLEHCFNIAQAAFNAANAVKVGGHILHVNPVSMVNHGFYNLSPTWYYDFYKANDFEIIEAFAANSESVGPFPHKSRISYAPEVSAYVLARRKAAKCLEYPIQAKYQ